MDKSEHCFMCGTAPWEWEEDRFAYEPVEEYCHGCYLKATAQDSNALPGTTVNLKPARGRDAVKRQMQAERRWAKREVEEDDTAG